MTADGASSCTPRPSPARSRFESPIPAHSSLLGLRCVIQALLVGGKPGVLTNAQDLVLGEY